ncbi:hypothetical protein [Actinacidiphila glaucinigra]|uniref:hypothetical protein n=1 Tax=Actinacidiphila glaucinigra TaxID=235986 RepID=UPI003D8EC493
MPVDNPALAQRLDKATYHGVARPRVSLGPAVDRADAVAQATRTGTLGVCVASVVALLLLLPLSLFL